MGRGVWRSRSEEALVKTSDFAGTWHPEEILITVKAYPNPQEDFGEASCTAGMTADGRWLRVNPVPFRQLRADQKFEKWDWIRATVRPGGDTRPESHVVQPESITPLRKVDTGKNRDWVSRNARNRAFHGWLGG